MGNFVHLSTLLSTLPEQTVEALSEILGHGNGGLEATENGADDEEVCIINSSNGNSNILFPTYFDHWELSRNISERLHIPVLVLEIYDGDFWLFVLFDNGKEVSRFNPVPEYEDETIDLEQIHLGLPDVYEFCNYFPAVHPTEIDKYFVHWKSHGVKPWVYASDTDKAYPTDQYPYGSGLQLFDFIKKIGITYPIDDTGKIKGDTFKIWTRPRTKPEPNPFELAREIIRKSARYHPDSIDITEPELQYLTGLDYKSYIDYFGGTFYCTYCQERHPVLNPSSRLDGEGFLVEMYGHCKKCGNPVYQGIQLHDMEKIKTLFK